MWLIVVLSPVEKQTLPRSMKRRSLYLNANQHIMFKDILESQVCEVVHSLSVMAMANHCLLLHHSHKLSSLESQVDDNSLASFHLNLSLYLIPFD